MKQIHKSDEVYFDISKKSIRDSELQNKVSLALIAAAAVATIIFVETLPKNSANNGVTNPGLPTQTATPKSINR